MSLEQLLQDGLLIVLYSIRCGAALIASPIFGTRTIPTAAKIVVIFALGLIAKSTVASAAVVNIGSPDVDLIQIIMGEILTGAFIGLMLHLLFLLVTLAFEVSSIQMGFSIALIFDPINNAQVSILARFIVVLLIFLFFSLNLHHHLVAATTLSFTKVPLGSMPFLQNNVIENLVTMFSKSFETAIRLSLPILLLMMLMHICMGIISKTAPQMNLFFNVAFSIKLAIGLMVVVWLLPKIKVYLEIFATNLSASFFGLI